MTVFLDTSFILAALSSRDQRHRRAALTATQHGLARITSSLVINETVTLLQMRGRLSQALEFLADAQGKPDLQIVYPDPALQVEAWDLFVRWAGTGASPVDCLSFAIMRRLGIRKAFTFDEHFRTAGFHTLL